MELKNYSSPSTVFFQQATASQDFNSMFNDDCQYFDANMPVQQQNMHEYLTGKNDDCQYFDTNILVQQHNMHEYLTGKNDDWQYFDSKMPDQQQDGHEDLTGKDGMMRNSGFSTFNTSNSFHNSNHYQVINCEY